VQGPELNFTLESVTGNAMVRNYLEADRGLAYLRLFTHTNKVTFGNHQVNNYGLADMR
jgi:hypothetical protein